MKRILLIIALLVGVVAGVSGTAAMSSTTVSADAKSAICQGVTTVSGASCGSATSSPLTNIIKVAINLFSFVVATVSVVMIIFGGFRYITSGGDSSKVTSAKNTIIYAVIGLVVVAFAQFIVQFVLQKTTGPTTPAKKTSQIERPIAIEKSYPTVV